VARGHQVPAREGVEKPLHSRRFILRRPSPWNQRGGSEEAVSPFFRELRRQLGSPGNHPRASQPIGDERCRNVLELEQRRVTALDHDRCRAGPRPSTASGRTSWRVASTQTGSGWTRSSGHCRSRSARWRRARPGRKRSRASPTGVVARFGPAGRSNAPGGRLACIAWRGPDARRRSSNEPP
jgi:hypothetical protein